MEEYLVKPIGYIRSELKDRDEAPSFYTEGAPNARLELLPAYRDGLDRIEVGHEIIVLTWLHLARRDILKVHPQGNLSKPLTGVFLTRSPADGLLIGPIEAIDGTPVLDIKPVVEEADDF